MTSALALALALAAAPLVQAHDRVILFGDSITSIGRYVGWLDSRLAQGRPDLDLDIRAIGVSGASTSTLRPAKVGGGTGYETTAGFARRVVAPEVRSSSWPAPVGTVVVLQFGGNDANSASWPAFGERLTAIRAALPAEARIVLLGPTALDHARYTGCCGPAADFDARLQAVADLGRAWAAAHGAAYVDLYPESQALFASGPPAWGAGWTTDGGHEDYPGAAVRAQALARVLLDEPAYQIAPICDRYPECDRAYHRAYQRALYSSSAWYLLARAEHWYLGLGDAPDVRRAQAAGASAANAILDRWRVELGWPVRSSTPWRHP